MEKKKKKEKVSGILKQLFTFVFTLNQGTN